MRSTLLALALALAVAPAARAQADDRPLATLTAVQNACRAADGGDSDALYSVTIEGSWRFDEAAEDFLPIDTRRNLRALSGSVELLPSHMEMIGFVANEARAHELEAARAAGARLRVGFFLGFDDPERSSCLVRPAAAVTLVRMDVAFVELVDASGGLVAREDTERYRAWHDDAGRDEIEGTGPRGVIGSATVTGGSLPDGWARAFRTASGGATGRALGRCHREGVARGAVGDAIVRVRLSVDGRTGHVSASSVEIANVGDEDEVQCIVDAIAHVDLPAGSGDVVGRTVDVSVPVTLAD
jgi:hypothetical protein